MLQSGVTLFEQACFLCGHDTLLMDMAADEEFFSALFDRIQRLVIPCVRALLDEVGPWTRRARHRRRPGHDGPV